MLMFLLLTFLVLLVIFGSGVSSGGARVRINDLGRWKQYGGTLERPRPPVAMRIMKKRER